MEGLKAEKPASLSWLKAPWDRSGGKKKNGE